MDTVDRLTQQAARSITGADLPWAAGTSGAGPAGGAAWAPAAAGGAGPADGDPAAAAAAAAAAGAPPIADVVAAAAATGHEVGEQRLVELGVPLAQDLIFRRKVEASVRTGVQGGRRMGAACPRQPGGRAARKAAPGAGSSTPALPCSPTISPHPVPLPALLSPTLPHLNDGKRAGG